MNGTDVATLAALLHETEQLHGQFERTHQKHEWWFWYAAYMLARQGGKSSDEAAADATRYMEQEKGVRPL